MSLFMLYLICLLQATQLFVLSCPYINQIFSSTLELNSNNCIIDSCLFINNPANAVVIKANGINITITIRNCQFTNITGYSIILTGNSHIENIVIEHNTFDALHQTAIFSESTSHVDHELTITDNTFSNINNYAIRTNSNSSNVSVIGNKIYQVYRGIYIQASNYNIINNEIHQVTMHAIQVGAFGNIKNNILYDITAHAIAYIRTQLQSQSNQNFIIENNMIYNVNKTAIYMNARDYKIKNIMIRFNTIIVHANYPVIKIINASNSTAEVYGNMLLNPDNEPFISTDNLFHMSFHCNLKSSQIHDIGFVMYNESNIDSDMIDLHISKYSWETYGYCNGYNFDLPTYDIDGDIRGSDNRIDVGADRIATKLPFEARSHDGEYVFIGIVFTVLLICILFVVSSSYRRHKKMQETYKNASHFVKPRTQQQTNKIMKMMIGDDETNTDRETQTNVNVDKGNILNLRTENVTDEGPTPNINDSANMDIDELDFQIVYE